MKISDLKTGDLVFTKPKDLVGRIISRKQKIGYSHVGFITSSGGMQMFNESEIIKGVHSSGIQQRLSGLEVTIMRPIFTFDEETFSKSANDKIGCKYDTVGIINQIIKEWIGVWLDRDQADNDKAFYCSKYYAYCLSRSTDKFKNYNEVDLNDLYNNREFIVVLYCGILKI